MFMNIYDVNGHKKGEFTLNRYKFNNFVLCHDKKVKHHYFTICHADAYPNTINSKYVYIVCEFLR